jgi:hypothetical protein
VIVLPDIVGPIVAWYATVPEVTAIFGDRIGTQLPATDNWPAARLDPIGGIAIYEYRLDQPAIQIHSFDLTDLGAMAGARLLRAGIYAMVGYRQVDELVVCDVTTSSPRLLPDESRTPPIAHATFTATITVRPDP